MRHRIKKIPSLISKHIHLLHSDKSTYYALRFGPLSHRKVSNRQRPVLFSSEKRGFRKKMVSYASVAQNRDAYFYDDKLGFNSIVKTIPLVLSAFTLLLVLGALILPYDIGGVGKASAVATIPDPKFSIQLSLGDIVKTEEEVNAGVVGYIANDFTISTASTESYSIYLTPDTEGGYTNKLIGERYQDEITGVGSNVSVGEFGRNTWGYGLTDTNNIATPNMDLTYSTIPDGSKPIKTVASPDDGDDVYKLVFAARISDDKPADHYQSQAVLSVVGSAKQLTLSTNPVQTWDELITMQQMSSAACESASVNDTKQLIDTRDQKTYWVTKLNDSNCWMTQNLDLDLYVDGANRTLTPEDSNVSENWTSTTGPSTISGYSSSNYYLAQYYDPGDKYCNTGNCNATTTSNDEHDHQGNFYSWTAATAGADTSSVTSGNVSSSICPKGWQLPLSNSGTNTKTFQALTNALGATSGTSTGSSDSKLLTSPAYFVRSGYVDSGSILRAGSLGGYWSSTAVDSDRAYYLYFNSSAVYPFSYNYRYYGYSVRCVAE